MIIEHSEIIEKRVYPTRQETFSWLASKGFRTQTEDFSQKRLLKPIPLEAIQR
jgi:hypothetical protein